MTGARTPHGVETLRAQVQFLSRVIAASMVLMFLAVALPWLARMIEVGLSPLAWTLTAFAAWHAALTIASERLNDRVAMRRLLYAVPLCGLVFMALLWHYAGGVGHPSLALMMALPVVASAALPRAGFAIDLALYSILVVTITAVITSPDLAWYVGQLGIAGTAVAQLGGEELLRRDPFPGATTTPAAMFLFVLTFAAIQLAAAIVATRVARFLRSREAVAAKVEEEGAVDTLPAAALRTMPAVTLVVIAATGQIVQATRRFAQRMLLHNEAIAGRELFALLTFDDPNAVRALLAEGGEIAFCRYWVGAEEREANVQAETFEHEGITYTTVVIEDWNDAGDDAAESGSQEETR